MFIALTQTDKKYLGKSADVVLTADFGNAIWKTS